jgi:hypothetical protein
MKRSSGPREAANLSESVSHHLNMYGLAAGAAGIGMLTSVTPAEARIIYTAAHVRISETSPFFLDLNHDGTNDFFLRTYAFSPRPASSGVAYFATVYPFGANRIWEDKSGRYTPALKAGIRIRPERPFPSGSRQMGTVTMNRSKGTSHFFGPWANGGKGVRNRYLSLKFVIKGKTHFGWARLSMNVTHGIALTLSGYAYETIPNKPIISGKTKATDGVVGEASPIAPIRPASDLGTLGQLALGSAGLSIWRREESVGSLP